MFLQSGLKIAISPHPVWSPIGMESHCSLVTFGRPKARSDLI